MHHLAACAIFKNEAPHLAEWLAFMTLQGVEHFYLYNNESSDDWAPAVRAFGDRCTVHDVAGPRAQYPAYNHCLQTYGPHARWIAFIDLDEFLFSTSGTLADALTDYEFFAGVAVNWMTFGFCGHETRPPGLTIENYLLRPPADLPFNCHVKSIVRPAAALHFDNPHFPLYRVTGAVNEDGVVVVGPATRHPTHRRLRVNHYFTRSRAEWEEKMYRGRADIGPGRAPHEADVAQGTHRDDLAAQHAPAVRALLNSRGFPLAPPGP
jgi:hypothetical protein